uniref:Uncharacterized protein n=1 Tax=Anguilla anguilla TaxID=7936 RepID=A0A0E9RV13_ANGAN
MSSWVHAENGKWEQPSNVLTADPSAFQESSSLALLLLVMTSSTGPCAD